jgi:hypothetical protein
MHEDVMFHARVTSPFSSSTSTLVDAPVATIDISKPSTPKLETAEAANADELKPFRNSASQMLVPVDSSDSIELEESISEAPKVGTIEIDPPHINISQFMTPKPLLGETPDVNLMYNSRPTTSEPVLPNISDAHTPKNGSIPEEESLHTSNKLQIWFGDLSRSGFDGRYLSLRDQLSDAAFRGGFNTVLHVLADVERAYQQSWANAPRLSKQFCATMRCSPVSNIDKGC